MTCVIGIDIGGTNLRIGTVTRNGELKNFEKKSSAELVLESAIEKLGNEIEKYISKYKLDGKVQAIAIGVPSIVSKDKSFIYSTPNLKGIENLDLGNLLRAHLHIPVFVDRDVNYLLLNDIQIHNLDPERNKTILGFYIGTGFGNAVYINGKTHIGKNGVAGELGHIPMYGINEYCTCGNIGCSETRCSGRYLQKLMEEHFPETFIEDAFEKHRDEPIMQEYVQTLSIPIATEINILDPDYSIIAGGVVFMKAFPKELLISEIRKRTRKPYPEINLEFIFTEHTQQSGVLGGAAYVFGK